MVGLTGLSHLGKASFLQELLPEIVSDSDLLFAGPSAENAREAIEFSRSEPLQGDFRVIAFYDADALLENVQDAYLKLFEEPPERCFILVTCSDVRRLMPPLQSRIRLLTRWTPLSPEEMRQFAESVSAVDEELLRICGGFPGLYKHMLGQDKYKSFYNELKKAVDGRKNLLLEPIPEAVSDLKEPGIDRDCVAHICGHLARTNNIPVSTVARVLKYASTLISSPYTNAEIHWLRMASQLGS